MSLKFRQILGVSVGVIGTCAIALASSTVWRTIQGDRQVITIPSRQDRQDRFYETEFRNTNEDWPRNFKIPPRKGQLKETEAPPLKSGHVESPNHRESDKAVQSAAGTAKQLDEVAAAAKLKEAQDFKSKGQRAKAKQCCLEIISKYGETKTGAKAVELFNSLDE
jgi:hypothetical protein